MERIGAVGAALTPVLANILPTLGETAKSVAYLFAALRLLAAGIIHSFRRQKLDTVSLKNIEGTSEKAVLRGLLPFEDGDKLIGRDTEIQDLITIIKNEQFRFGVIWGPLGSGKTSLLRAGLVPALRVAGLPSQTSR